MEELVKLVMEKTGLPEEQARMAVQTVINFLKEKLPAPIAGQIDGALSSAGPSIAQGLGGLLGR